MRTMVRPGRTLDDAAVAFQAFGDELGAVDGLIQRAANRGGPKLIFSEIQQNQIRVVAGVREHPNIRARLQVERVRTGFVEHVNLSAEQVGPGTTKTVGG